MDGDQILWDGSIPAGGSVTLVFKARIDSTAEDGSEICNQGIVHWDSDGNGTNESPEGTNDPATPADDDPTCFTVSVGPRDPALSGTIDAPTLSEWGMIVLSCLMAVAFWLRARRRISPA